jgi:hypothetical protein
MRISIVHQQRTRTSRNADGTDRVRVVNVAPVGGTRATALQSDRGDRGVQDDFTSPQAVVAKQSSKGPAALRPSGRSRMQKGPAVCGAQVPRGPSPRPKSTRPSPRRPRDTDPSFLEPRAFFRRVRRCQVALKFLPAGARLSGVRGCSLSPDAACRGRAADRFADSHK